MALDGFLGGSTVDGLGMSTDQIMRLHHALVHYGNGSNKSGWQDWFAVLLPALHGICTPALKRMQSLCRKCK